MEKPNYAPVSLSQAERGLKRLQIGAGWDFDDTKNDPTDVDLCCFILGKDNMTREDSDFVFYNNPQGAALSVKHLGDNVSNANEADNEAIMIDLDSLSFDAWRIVFVVAIYDGAEHDKSFSKLRSLNIRAENADNGTEIHRFTIKNAAEIIGGNNAAALKVAEIYRDGVEWFFMPMVEPAPGLGEIAKSYGLLISSTT